MVADLPSQVARATLPRYSDILVQIGANDVIRFHSVTSVSQNLSAILKTLPPADHVYLMMAGDIGAATIFPAPMRPYYTHATLAYHAAFTEGAKENGVVYVNLYQPAVLQPFLDDPDRYLAADGLHPSSDGYALWFDALVKAIQNP